MMLRYEKKPIPLKNRAYRGRKNLTGFTFIEVLIASTIFAVISIAVYGTFNSGMNIWRRAENFNLEGRKRLLKLEKINRELRNTFVFRKQELYFNGDKSRIEIPVIADSEINKVTYRFDPAKKTLFRSSTTLADIAAAKEKKETITSREAPYISDVDGVTYSYFYFDLQKAAYAWRDDWQQEILPLAVKINITFINETYTASIFIPSA
jgi:prepilin-type N-terminal cleavage/methylation domain-containing protein